MADLTPQERLQPALLDRLTDEEPDKKQEPRERRVMTKVALREAVLRDLAWLFNSSRMSDIDWAGLQHASRSVINYGLPALSGETASSLDVTSLEAEIRRSIIDFEPRIMASTLKVEALVTEAQLDQHNVVSIRISGNLWAQPVPFELMLRTEVDLETGQVQIEDLSR